MNRFSWPERAFFAFLLATVLTGTVFRSLMAGLDWGVLASLDWRRAHSHLGYYGVLFPATWIFWSAGLRWVPGGKLLLAYHAFVVASAAGFLAQGYGAIATGASSLVLLIWLLFAWKNRVWPGFGPGSALDSVPLNTFLAALCIPAIAILSKREPALVSAVVRMFMTLLMLGVFIPSILTVPSPKSTRPLLWVFLPVLAAIDAANFADLWPLRAGTVAYGSLVASTVIASHRSRAGAFPAWLTCHWLLFAAGFALQGLGALPRNHAVAIAGIHYLVLGPILLTFFHSRMPAAMARPVSTSYKAALFVMVGSILLQPFWLEGGLVPQRIAAASGGVIVLCLLAAVFSAARGSHHS